MNGIWFLTTGVCILQEVDMYSITLDDLTFSSPFSLCCRRNDYIQAFVTYFTIDFTKCHKPTGFSTGYFLQPSETR